MYQELEAFLHVSDAYCVKTCAWLELDSTTVIQ